MNIDLADEYFGREIDENRVAIFHNSGRHATRLNANVYPVGSKLSARYEHVDGITLTRVDAERLGLEIEPIKSRDRED